MLLHLIPLLLTPGLPTLTQNGTATSSTSNAGSSTVAVDDRGSQRQRVEVLAPTEAAAAQLPEAPNSKWTNQLIIIWINRLCGGGRTMKAAHSFSRPPGGAWSGITSAGTAIGGDL